MFADERVRAALFGQDRVGREGALQYFDCGDFGFAIGLGDEIDRTGLPRDADMVQALHVHAAGRPGRANRDFLDFLVGRHATTLRERDALRQRAAAGYAQCTTLTAI